LVQFAAVKCGVISADIAEARFDEHVVATLHFFHGPAECVRGLLRHGHRLRQQVRQPGVLPHLHLLGVDEDELHLLGRGAHQQRGDEAIEHARLACAGCTGNK